MKQYLIPILTILVLASSLLVGCGQKAEPTPETTPATKPDARLIEFQQMKVAELNQVDAKLDKLQSTIAERQSEYDRLKEPWERAEERMRQKGDVWGMTATSEELRTQHKMAEVSQELSRLKLEERRLLFIRQYLKQRIDEVRQYASLIEYYQFKLSQLEQLEAKLFRMQLDWEQEIIVKGGSLEHSSRHPLSYETGLLERELLQQDIRQLEHLLPRE